MNINILTWWNVINYGSLFQAYALQEKIKEINGNPCILMHERKIPNYNRNTLESYTLKGLFGWIRNMSPSRYQYRRSANKKIDLYNDFYKEYLNIESKNYDLHDENLLIGSDQIFDIKTFFYPWQFGGKYHCKEINTYAPSFGETDWNLLDSHPAKDYISKCISNINVLNARDENTSFILEKIVKKNVPIVLDPVLLYSFDKEKDDKNWNYRLIKQPYCAVYTWGGYTTNLNFATKCRAFSQKLGLKLVSVGEPRPWCDIQMSSASPKDFFSIFMYADMVLTNMFHGTCFSIIMQRPFYSFVMTHNMNKLGGLLKELNLESQLLHSPEELSDKQKPCIDYDKLNKLLSIKRNFSFDQLQKCIN